MGECWNDNRQYGIAVELLRSLHDCDSDVCLFVMHGALVTVVTHMFDCVTVCERVDCVAPLMDA